MQPEGTEESREPLTRDSLPRPFSVPPDVPNYGKLVYTVVLCK